MSDKETEIKYAVIDEDPEQVCDRIAAMTEVDDFTLRDPEQVVIEDIYYEAPAGELRKLRWALRTRKLDGRAMVTLKGKSVLGPGGLITRTEVERPWSKEGLSKIVEILGKIGVSFTSVEWRNAFSSEVCLEQMGFVAIQERRTTRRTRQVYSLDNTRVAELAIDRVAFVFGDLTVLHHEIEIEAAHTDTSETLRFSRRVANTVGPTLKLWVFNKLEMGYGITELIKRSDWSRLIDAKGILLPDAYPELDKVLRGS